MPPSDSQDKDASNDRRICRSMSRIDAGCKGEKDRKDFSEYFGALKDSPLLDRIEADAKRIREMGKPRSQLF
jgi:hypothetical protein